jgi:RNA polymerase sigma-70 factor, ECF subfamily
MTDIRGLLEPYLPNLWRYAHSLTHDASRADDLVQSCLVRALTNQHLWREGTDLRAWLFTILHNLFISEVRRLAREQKRLAILDMKPAVMPGSDPELSYRVREVQDALRRLPASQSEIILQIALDNVMYENAASNLDIPIGTVRSRLARARESLRAMTDRESSPRLPNQ